MCGHSDKQESGIAPEKQSWTLRLAELYVTFVLQVLGGCGAVWGFSEAISVRGGANNDNWRVVSLVIGAGCLARWMLLQVKQDRRLDGVLATFLLQVCGAVGAIWGAAEIVGLRINYPADCHDARQGSTGTFSEHRLTEEFQGVAGAWAPGFETCENTYVLWNFVCGVVFVAFFCRWNRMIPNGAVFKFLDLHVATFVLDVLGGGGAIWGCSEVFGFGGSSLRLGWGDTHFGQPSFDFWRKVCAPVFAVCLLLWLKDWQKREEACGQEESAVTEAPVTVWDLESGTKVVDPSLPALLVSTAAVLKAETKEEVRADIVTEQVI